jgi:DNA mismatch repair ATPase MutS
MKAFLMYKGQDFDLKRKLPPHDEALTQDLELNVLFNAMALGDHFLFEVANGAVLNGVDDDLDTILYRQNILKDCLRNASLVRDIYGMAVAAIEGQKKSYWTLFRDDPDAILRKAVENLQAFVTTLKKLKTIADGRATEFESEGFTALFAMLRKELDDAYFMSVQNHLRQLKFRGGVLISAELGEGNQGINYVLRKSRGKEPGWLEQIFTQKPRGYTFYIHPRDEGGARALSELNGRGVNLVANALARSRDHMLNFFNMLRTELAFYVGCLNLHGLLTRKGEPVSFPVPAPSSERRCSFKGLYDVGLALNLEGRVVANEVNADDKQLVMITGANQGGKSTFLRSVGLAQLMMQCGMFVPAEFFAANVCDGLFTHYKREEDATMKSGKLDEELSRMSNIVDGIRPSSMVLFNESFAATNEREGSEIARQIVGALLEQGVKVFFVTHLYAFAHGCFEKKIKNALFLRAERQADGGRTFKLIEGEPLQTSYGEDLYKAIFVGREASPGHGAA